MQSEREKPETCGLKIMSECHRQAHMGKCKLKANVSQNKQTFWKYTLWQFMPGYYSTESQQFIIIIK